MNFSTAKDRSPGAAAMGTSCRVEDALGRFSSHPRWSGRQLRTWYAIASAPLLCGAALLGWYMTSDPDAAVTLLVNYGRPLVLVGVTATAFAAGLSLTAALAVQARRCRRIVDDVGAPRWILVAAACAMIGIALVMLGISMTTRLPPRAKTLVTSMGLLPLVAILCALRVTLRAEGDDGRGIDRDFKPWTILIPAVPLAFVMATQIEPVSQWLASFDVISRIILFVGQGNSGVNPETLRRWVVTAVAALVASPLVAAAIAAMTRFWHAAARAAGSSATPADASPVYPLLGEEAPAPRTQQDWDGFPDDPLLTSLMGGRMPTAFERSVMERITSAPALVRGEMLAKPAWERPSADLHVEGEPGCGRTTAVVAAIVNRALCHGSHALVLVPDSESEREFEHSVHDALGAAGLSTFLDVVCLDSKPSSDWLDGSASPGAPVVVITTLDRFERTFFGSTSQPDRRRAALRAIGSVVVDDADRFSFNARMHLPFVLQKLRLFLAATGDCCQTIVISRPLLPARRRIIRQQLLDDRDAPDFIKWQRSQDAPSSGDDPVIPLADTAAVPLFVRHLCSVARLLPGRHPIHLCMWSAFGLPSAHDLRAAAPVSRAPDREPLRDRQVLLDPPAPEPAQVAHGHGDDWWPWAALERSDQPPRPLAADIDDPIDAGAGLLLAEDGDRVTPVISQPQRAPRVAEVRYEQSMVGRLDLAYATRLMWQRDDVRYWLRAITRDPTGLAILDVAPAADGQRAKDRAVLQLEKLVPPEPFTTKSLGVESGPCGNRLTAYSVSDEAPLESQWSLTARYDDQGAATPVAPPIEYGHASVISAIIIDQPFDRLAPSEVGADLRAGWPAQGGTIIPELGTALSAALAKVAPGLERLARCIGIRLGAADAADGRYAVLLIEPTTTAASARKCLVEMLLDSVSATSLLKEVAESLLPASAGAAAAPAAAVRAGHAIAPRMTADGRLAVDAGVSASLATLFRELAASAAASTERERA